MAHRENVSIKTRYETVEECMENCRDIKKRWVAPLPGSRKIYGTVNEDGSFLLSSQRKMSAIFEFEGIIEERSDGIYMEGDIRPKSAYKWWIYIVNAILSVLGVYLIFRFTPVLMVMGSVYIGIGWIYFFGLSYFDGLYGDLLNKLA